MNTGSRRDATPKKEREENREKEEEGRGKDRGKWAGEEGGGGRSEILE